MVFGGAGLLDFEDSLGASNIGFVKCINSLGFEGRRSPRPFDHSLRKSLNFFKKKT